MPEPRASMAIALVALLVSCAPPVPDYPPVRDTTWLDQGWTNEQRNWYHQASQGTLTFGIPYEWFVVLEKPDITIGDAGRFADKAYLDRFGFIPGDGALPVGFARGGPLVDPVTGATTFKPGTQQPLTGIGLTCAACHTGRMTYQGQEILIDGGSAITDLGKFRAALGLALGLTDTLPLRFGRFAERVLGPDATPDAKATLHKEVTDLIKRGKALRKVEEGVAANSVEEGFGRLDALNRIGNEVFALRLGNMKNFAATNAPVHYPPIWNAPWYTWVQYNGSIMQPMVRNAGEALGVRALTNLTPDRRPLFDSAIDFRNLVRMEDMLAGTPPWPKQAFSGLRSPTWPAHFPAIRPALAEQGRAVYEEHCQGCHRPAPNTQAFWTGPWWVTLGKGKDRYLDLKQVALSEIGTDPMQATGMKDRKVAVPDTLGLGTDAFGPALGTLVEKVVNRGYDVMVPPPTAAERARMNGNRPNGIQAKLEYKARPLNGIWASPPYLHNGSVPTIDDLLKPADQRPKTFTLGNREYDPVKLGYLTASLSGGFELNTALKGNSNQGHEFRDGPRGNGVIGPALTDDQRLALIEYLKTL